MTEKFTSIEKAFKVIDCLVEGKQEWSLAELTDKLAMPKTSLYRLCGILTKHEYLSKSSETGKYRLGLKLLEISDAYRNSSMALTSFQEILEQVQVALGETVSIFRLSGLERKCVMRIESKNALRHSIEIGKKLPLHIGASGLVLLAFSPESLLDDYLNNIDVSHFYLHSDDLKNRMARVRSRKYEISFGERSSFTAAAAVPLFKNEHELFGTLSISGPVERFRQNIKDEQIAMIQDYGQQLSRLIKHL